MRKDRKKIGLFTGVILIAIMLVSGITMFATNTSGTPEDDSTYWKIVKYDEIKDYRNNPKDVEGYIFAGWFTDKSCIRQAALDEDVLEGTAYAKYVPEEILGLKAQVSNRFWDSDFTNDENGTIRFITSVDSTSYQEVGFVLNIGNGDRYKANQYVYETIYADMETADKNSATVTYTPGSTFHASSKYFKTWTVKNIDFANFETEFQVTPYWVTLDGTTVKSDKTIKTVNQGRSWTYVFVDEAGDDTNGVGTKDSPYKTLNTALAQMAKNFDIAEESNQETEPVARTVYVKDSLVFPSDYSWSEHGLDVSLKGYADDASIDFSAVSNLNIQDAVAFDHIQITWPESGNNPRVLANGHKVVVGENVTTTNECNQILGGGGGSTAVASTDLRLYAGTYKTIYGGVAAGPVTGDTNVIIGGNVNSGIDTSSHSYTYQLYGAGWQGSVQGNTNITVADGAKFNYVFGGGQDAAEVKGSTNIDFAGDAYGVYGGSYSGTNSDTHVKIQAGAEVYQVFGGSQNASMTGNTDVQILGGTIRRRVYGGCYNEVSALGAWSTEYCVTGNTSVAVWPAADLKFDVSDSDVALYSISRANSTFDEEKGAFIFNQDHTCSDKVGQQTTYVSGYFSSQSSHYQVLTNGNTTEDSVGTVSAAGTCIHIEPASGKKATVTIGGTVVHYTEGESYFPLPAEVSDAPIQISVAFVDSADAFAWEAKIGDAYYATVEEAEIAIEESTTGKIELDDSVTDVTFVDLTINDSENGKVITDKRSYRQGQDITLTLVPDEGYNGVELKMNGAAVTLDDLSYTFTASETAYTVEAAFTRKVFADTTDTTWILSGQYTPIGKYDGTVTSSSARTKDSTELNLYDTYGDIDLTVNARDYINNSETTTYTAGCTVIKLKFNVDGTTKYAGYRIGYMDNTYKVQSYGGIHGWVKYYSLSASEIAAYQSEEGLDFRVVRSGTDIFLYVGGNRICEATDLTIDSNGSATGITADMPATVSVKEDGNIGQDVDIKFAVSDTAPERAIMRYQNLPLNGTISTALAKYLVGDSVVLNVSGATGYYYDSLKVDDSDVTLDWNTGAYTFVASQKEHTIEGTFAEGIFDDASGVGNWMLFNQNRGLLKGNGSNTGWLKTKDNYSVVTVGLKNTPSTSTGMSYGMHVRYYFTDDVFVDVQIIEWAGNYVLKSADSSAVFGNNKEYLNLASTTAIAQKIESEEGVQLKIVQSGTKLMFYIDGALQTMKSGCQGGKTYIDLTKTYDGSADNGKGITATSQAKIVLRSLSQSAGQEIPFTLSNPIITNHVDETNGTISFAKSVDEYAVGEEVVMTIARTSGYYPNIQVNGEQVIFESDGTYTFTAQEANTITGAFEAGPWSDKANWDLLNQRSNIIKTSYTGTGSGWLDAQGSYEDVTIRVKDYLGLANSTASKNGTAFESRVVFQFDTNGDGSNDINAAIRLYNNEGKYQLQGLGGDGYVYNGAFIMTIADTDLINKIQNEGIDWKIVREGTMLKMYLDGEYVSNNASRLDLTKIYNTTTSTGITADSSIVRVSLVNYGNKNCDIEIPFRLAETVQTADIDTTGLDTANGTVSFDKDSYLVGEKVTMSITPNSTYYPNIQLNGEQIVFAADKTYTFIAQETNTMTGAFTKGPWDDKANWDLLNQNSNIITTSYTGTGSGWLDAQGDYEEITVRVKDYLGVDNSTAAANGTAFEARVIFQFDADGDNQSDTNAALRLYNNGGKYQIQGIDGDKYVFRGAYITTLDAALSQKIQTEGVEWKVVRDGTKLKMYINGVQITQNQDRLDLTKFYGTTTSTGITTDTNVIRVTLVNYGNQNCAIEIPFNLVKRSSQVALNITDTIGGTVVAAKNIYRVKDTVKLVDKAKSGYA